MSPRMTPAHTSEEPRRSNRARKVTAAGLETGLYCLSQKAAQESAENSSASLAPPPSLSKASIQPARPTVCKKSPKAAFPGTTRAERQIINDFTAKVRQTESPTGHPALKRSNKRPYPFDSPEEAASTCKGHHPKIFCTYSCNDVRIKVNADGVNIEYTEEWFSKQAAVRKMDRDNYLVNTKRFFELREPHEPLNERYAEEMERQRNGRRYLHMPDEELTAPISFDESTGEGVYIPPNKTGHLDLGPDVRKIAKKGQRNRHVINKSANKGIIKKEDRIKDLEEMKARTEAAYGEDDARKMAIAAKVACERQVNDAE